MQTAAPPVKHCLAAWSLKKDIEARRNAKRCWENSTQQVYHHLLQSDLLRVPFRVVLGGSLYPQKWNIKCGHLEEPGTTILDMVWISVEGKAKLIKINQSIHTFVMDCSWRFLSRQGPINSSFCILIIMTFLSKARTNQFILLYSYWGFFPGQHPVGSIFKKDLFLGVVQKFTQAQRCGLDAPKTSR